jgi:hypothetical protein
MNTQQNELHLAIAAAFADEHPTLAERAANAVVDSEPVTLAVLAVRMSAYMASAVRLDDDMQRTAAHMAESLKGIASHVARLFAGADTFEKFETARKEVTAAVIEANAVRAKVPGAHAISEETCKRYVRTMIAESGCERPASTAPKAVRQKLARDSGAILGALHVRDNVALAAAIKRAGGEDSELVQELRDTHAALFYACEVDGKKRDDLLALIATLSDDSPTMTRIYAAAIANNESLPNAQA